MLIAETRLHQHMKQRIAYIDRLRGFAILAVVVGHITIHPLEITNDYIGLIVGTFHVPLLFFLSGICISTPPSCKNLAGKLLRFMMPFITVGSTFAIVSGNGIKTFVQAQMHLGYWYLLVLSIFYLLLMPFHLNKQGGTKRKFSIDLLVAFGIWTLLFVANHNLPGGNIWSSQQCFNYWPVFMLGFFCRRYEFTKYAVEHNLIFSVSLIASVAMTIFYLHGYGAILRLIFPFSAITLFMLFYYYRERNLRINRLLEWLGRNSLDIYIYQYLLIWTGLISLPGLGQWFHDTNNVLLELLFTLLGGLMVSTLCIVIGKILRQSKLLRVLVYGEYASKNKYSNVLCLN